MNTASSFITMSKFDTSSTAEVGQLFAKNPDDIALKDADEFLVAFEAHDGDVALAQRFVVLSIAKDRSQNVVSLAECSFDALAEMRDNLREGITSKVIWELLNAICELQDGAKDDDLVSTLDADVLDPVMQKAIESLRGEQFPAVLLHDCQAPSKEHRFVPASILC